MPATWYKTHGGQQSSATLVGAKGDEKGIKRGVPFRIEYPLAKSHACVQLMGHSFILRCMEQLLETVDFVPTWDSLVFKMEGDGVPIRWHRDASAESVGFDTPAIDVGFYLDAANADLGNCLWVVPGSHKWPDFLAGQLGLHLTKAGFNRNGAVPVAVQPGDVILHNILVLHGSSSSTSPLRRTVYYEYRSIPHELKFGPHLPKYIPLKQRTSRLPTVPTLTFQSANHTTNYLSSTRSIRADATLLGEEKRELKLGQEHQPNTLRIHPFPRILGIQESTRIRDTTLLPSRLLHTELQRLGGNCSGRLSSPAHQSSIVDACTLIHSPGIDCIHHSTCTSSRGTYRLPYLLPRPASARNQGRAPRIDRLRFS